MVRPLATSARCVMAQAFLLAHGVMSSELPDQLTMALRARRVTVLPDATSESATASIVLFTAFSPALLELIGDLSLSGNRRVLVVPTSPLSPAHVAWTLLKHGAADIVGWT